MKEEEEEEVVVVVGRIHFPRLHIKCQSSQVRLPAEREKEKREKKIFFVEKSLLQHLKRIK